MLAFIVEATADMVPGEVGTAGLQDAKYVARASGSRAFWELLAQALADCNVSAVAVSLNSHCVLDDELPARLEQACTLAAGNADWAVLAATGKCVAGNTYSVVYPSAAPRFFACSVPIPIVDCGLELFVLNADFLRALPEGAMDGRVATPECFPQWCILTGYLQGRVSVFRPEMAIGVNGRERGRDWEKVVSVVQRSFSDHLFDAAIPSLMGDVPNTPQERTEPVDGWNQRSVRLPLPATSLTDLVRLAAQPAIAPMSISLVTRTQFSRDYLLRRLLASVTRARQTLGLELEVILTTDIDEQEAQTAHQALKSDFPEVELVLQVNRGLYPNSRVDNLMGGIFSAGKDYIAIVDDDDFVALDAFSSLSIARFLGQNPLLLMSSQIRNETWREAATGRWVLEQSQPQKTYYSHDVRSMFLGSNQLPICAMIAPRTWMQERLREIPLRHDLSEDYAIFLALFTAPDLPPLLTYDNIFCMISSRSDGSNTITMEDRRPWVRDITLFLHDLFVANPILGAGAAQILGRGARVAPDATARFIEAGTASDSVRNSREIAMLKAEIAYLRSAIAHEHERAMARAEEGAGQGEGAVQ